MQPAERIVSLPPYFFASLNQELDELKRKGVDVIRMDIGSPDMPPAPFILDALARAAARPDAHGYNPHGGTGAYRQAVAEYYRRRFGVALDPMKEVVGLIGSKEGIFNVSMVLVDPGDVVLVPDPGYPVYAFGAQMAGGEVVRLPLLRQNQFLPDLDAVPAETMRRVKLLWLNYPNNPTAAIMPLETMERLVGRARRQGFFICHDAPYMDVTFGDYSAPSILQVPGAKDVAVEFNSLSKTYNMAGWRLGMAVGNAEIVQALNAYKSNIDSGHFLPVLEGGVAALTGEQSWLRDRNRAYEERRDIIVDGLHRAAWEANMPQASLYVWAAVPGGGGSAEFCRVLLREAGVSLTPGITFGEHGEGYVRFSLGTATPRVREAMDRIVAWSSQRAAG